MRWRGQRIFACAKRDVGRCETFGALFLLTSEQSFRSTFRCCKRERSAAVISPSGAFCAIWVVPRKIFAFVSILRRKLFVFCISLLHLAIASCTLYPFIFSHCELCTQHIVLLLAEHTAERIYKWNTTIYQLKKSGRNIGRKMRPSRPTFGIFQSPNFMRLICSHIRRELDCTQVTPRDIPPPI